MLIYYFHCFISASENSIQFNSIQAFIDAAYMAWPAAPYNKFKIESILILVSVWTINPVEKKSFKFFPETRSVSGCTQL